MKKIFVAILTLVYVSISADVTLQMHHCIGKLSNWGLGQHESATCSKCGMEKLEKKDNGCCKEKYKFFQSQTDEKVTESVFQFIQILAVAFPVSFIEIPLHNFPTVTEENPIGHSPPLNYGFTFAC